MNAAADGQGSGAAASGDDAVVPEATAEPARPLRLRTLQWAYDVVYLLLVLLLSPAIVVMMIVSPRWRSGLKQRVGFVPRRTGERPAVLIHGVSAGELIAAKELVALIEREMPWVEVILTTTTRNGREAATRTYPDKLCTYYPLDFSFATRRVVRRLRPAVVLLMELELWPNFLLTCRLSGLPVLVANGKMSAKSARDYKRLQRLVPEPMTRVLRYCVQSAEYAERFQSLGVPADRITITGSMKFDTIRDRLPDEVRDGLLRRFVVADGAFVLLAGSTHSGEDPVVVAAFAEIRRRDPRARLVIGPRHPDRIREVEAAVRAGGLNPVRLSTLSDGWPPEIAPEESVVLIDTVGELARLYVVADLVFVGGSLTDRGGQNMMEPAGLGKPVVVGPNTWNFRDPMELLLTCGGVVQAQDADDVRAQLIALHGDPERRAALGDAARGVCRESKGATRRILDILGDYVPEDAVASGWAPATSRTSTPASEGDDPR